MTKLNTALGLVTLLASVAGAACNDEDPPASCESRCAGGLDGGSEGCSCDADDGGPIDSGSRDAAGDGDGDGDRDGSATDAGDDAGTLPPPCDAAAAPDVTGLNAVPVVTGLNNLVYAAQPKGTNDWYLVEQAGTIKVWRGNGNTTSVFLSLPEATNSGGSEERGLLSIAFPPDYASSGQFYVMLTPTMMTLPNHDMVLRFKRSAADPYVADLASKEVILDVPASASNHNGGTALFGPDGLLYVGTGDGGDACNRFEPGGPQDIDSLRGKILRLDPKKPAPYAAAGNPFSSNGDDRVLHYGLRNPFRFGFDRVTGDLYIGDVGQGSYEEIDFAPAQATGLNFGWAAFEGAVAATSLSNQAWCNAPDSMRPKIREGSTHTPPIVNIDRRGGGACTGQFCDYASVIGGVVYRGNSIEQLKGVYLFGDYGGARMGALYQCGDKTSPVSTLRKRCNGTDEACLPMAAGINELTGIVEGSDGEVYLVASRSKLMKLVEAAP